MLTADKVFAYVIFVIILLSLMEGFIIHTLDKKQLKIIGIILLIMMLLTLVLLFMDFNKMILMFLKYSPMIFSLISFLSLIIATLLIKNKRSEGKMEM